MSRSRTALSMGMLSLALLLAAAGCDDGAGGSGVRPASAPDGGQPSDAGPSLDLAGGDVQPSDGGGGQPADGGAVDVGPGSPDGGPGDAQASADGDADPDSGASSDGGPPPPPLELELPQAVGGALWANPAVYERIPLRVRVPEMRESLVAASVWIGEAEVETEATSLGSERVAWLPIGELPDGPVPIRAWARGRRGGEATVQAELVLGRQGVRLSDFDVHGAASTPRLHRQGDDLWLTWTDRSAGTPSAWMRRLDGAGRWIGDPVPLVVAPAEALHARTALGESSVGVLYQSPGQPYVTHFAIVGMDGTPQLGPIDLDPPDAHGRFGGELVFDGAGYVMVWRVLHPGGREEVLWQRVAEADGAVTGPVSVAQSGADDPHGGFALFSFVSLAIHQGTSVVGFVRGHWSNLLGMSIPKSQVAWVDFTGALLGDSVVGSSADFYYHRECRVVGARRGLWVVSSALDLGSPADNPANLLYGVRAGTAPGLDPEGALGRPLFNAVDDRDEPLLLWRIEADSYGVLAWLDHRAYTVDPPNGRIELYVAQVDSELHPGAETLFPHARFVAGLAQLKGVSLGSNALLVWLDERHGGGIANPRPELWLETAWY